MKLFKIESLEKTKYFELIKEEVNIKSLFYEIYIRDNLLANYPNITIELKKFKAKPHHNSLIFHYTNERELKQCLFTFYAEINDVLFFALEINSEEFNEENFNLIAKKNISRGIIIAFEEKLLTIFRI